MWRPKRLCATLSHAGILLSARVWPCESHRSLVCEYRYSPSVPGCVSYRRLLYHHSNCRSFEVCQLEFTILFTWLIGIYSTVPSVCGCVD